MRTAYHYRVVMLRGTYFTSARVTLSLPSHPLIIPLDRLPVDHIEQRRHITRAQILVFQIVSMLPHIDRKDRHESRPLNDRIVLIGARRHHELSARIRAQPRPSGAELPQCQRRQLLLERIHRSERLLYLGQQLSLRRLRRFRRSRQRVKIQIMIVESAPVIPERLPQRRILDLIQRCQQFFDIHFRDTGFSAASLKFLAYAAWCLA